MDNSIKTSNPQKKTPIGKFFLGLFLVIVFIIIWCVISEKISEKDVIDHLNSGDWGIGSKQEYIRDGKKCMGYRIYVKLDYASTEVYKDIFSYITKDDGYYLHTVWIYDFKHMANGSYSASYIMEQQRQGELPEPKRK